jgi:hypothetical protein
MLAFTMQFSRYGRDKSPPRANAQDRPRPLEKAPRKRLPPQDPTACPPSQATHAPVPQAPAGESVLAAPSRPGRVNNQCSTRKHGRRGRRSLPDGAGAP